MQSDAVGARFLPELLTAAGRGVRVRHLRQHHRMSQTDAELQAEALRFHIGSYKPEVHHCLAL